MKAIRLAQLALPLAVALAAPQGASGQRPVHVAEARFDVDGDGRPDVVRIGDGQVSVAITGAGAAAWKPFQTGGKMIEGRLTWGSGRNFGGSTVIVAEAGFRERPAGRIAREAIALEWRRGELHELWRGEVGPVGVDRESSLHIEATPAGLLLYEGRPGVERCDGATPHLFARRYDFSRKEFRPVSELVRVAADAPRLTASRVVPAGVAADSEAVAFRASAASSMENARLARDLVPPREIDDGDLATAWVEGKSSFGRGEFVTAHSTVGSAAVRALRLVPGHAASESSFRDNNRLKRVGLLVGSRAFFVEFPVDPARAGGSYVEPYWVELPEAIATDCVSVIIDEVYFGRLSRGHGRTAIAELAILTDVDLAPGGADRVLAERVAAGGDDGRLAARLLAERGQPAAAALLAEARRSGLEKEERHRLRQALARVPAGEEELAAGLAEPSLAPGDEQSFSEGLIALGAPAVPHLAGLLGDPQGEAARFRAAKALAQIADPAARDALVEAAGEGPRELRREVSRALGSRGVADLGAVLAAAIAASDEAEGREADLWRAVGILAREADEAERAGAARALAGRLAGAVGYELRYRLLDAAGALDEPLAVEAVAAALGASRGGPRRNSAEEIALRRVAVTALERGGSAHALPALLRALGDADPGVRRVAVSAIAVREDPDGRADQPLAARLADDPWPEVRRDAAAALGGRCGRDGPAQALLAAAARDADVDVRIASLSGLVSCRAAGIGDRLLELASSASQPGPVRLHAVHLMATLGERRLAAPVVELFSQFRRHAIGSASSVALAAEAAFVLGELGDPVAVPPLLEAARDPAFVEVQAGATRALGRLCPREAAPLLRELVRSGERAVKLAAQTALTECARRPRR